MKVHVLMAAVAAALAYPGAAGAATLTLTGDDGQQLPLSEGAPLQIRHMAPTLVPSFSSSEKQYSLQVLGPDGQSASFGANCKSTASEELPDFIGYRGNGTYTVTLTTVPSADDFYCEQNPTTQTFTFAINASTSVIAPKSPLMSRKPGGDAIAHSFRVGLNPGAGSYGLERSSGDSYAEFDVPRDGKVEIELDRAGTYAFSAFAIAESSPSSSAQSASENSPTSAPVQVKVLAPFDFQDIPYFRDATWPKFKLAGLVMEPSLIGKKVSVAIAKGSGKFKTLTTVKVDRTRELAVKFKRRKGGKYRFMYVFKGSDLVAPGAWVQKVKLSRSPSAKAPVYVG